MPVISCTHCGAKGNAPESVLGQNVRCSKCKQSFVAEEAGAALPAAVVEEDDVDEGIRDADEEPRPSSRRGKKNDEPDDEPDEEEDDEPPVPRRKPKSRSLGPNVVVDALLLRYYLGPYLLIAIFWIGSFYFVYLGLRSMIGVFQHLHGEALLTGLVFCMSLIIGGPIFMRVGCELAGAIFSIREMMADQISGRK